MQTVAKTRFQLSGRQDLDVVNAKATLISREVTPGLSTTLVASMSKKDFSDTRGVCAQEAGLHPSSNL